MPFPYCEIPGITNVKNHRQGYGFKVGEKKAKDP
jgi:hypothetical protein